MFDEDVRAKSFRADLSPEQLDALERRERQCEQQQQQRTPAAERSKIRMVGADRGRVTGGIRVD